MFRALSAEDRAVFDREAQRQKDEYETGKKQTAEKKIDEMTPTPYIMYYKQQVKLGHTSKIFV